MRSHFIAGFYVILTVIRQAVTTQLLFLATARLRRLKQKHVLSISVWFQSIQNVASHEEDYSNLKTSLALSGLSGSFLIDREI